jgi:SAM-dependent methyltransferase
MQVSSRWSLDRLSVADLLTSGGASVINPLDYPGWIAHTEAFNINRQRFLQSSYFHLSQHRQSGELNSQPTDVHYERHLARMRGLVSHAFGVCIDVGCGDTRIGAALLPKGCQYLGVDPFASDEDPHRLYGFAELLPLADQSVDCVVFNTSLDHVLDFVTALTEARRVIRPGGEIYVASLVWNDNFSLVPDDIHFHHFRYFELLGGLEFSGFRVLSVDEYPYKDDAHRRGAYIRAAVE